MREDKRCETCEWWETPQVENLREFDLVSRCLRWPGHPWLMTYSADRCWQHVKRTSETEESALTVPQETYPDMCVGVGHKGVLERDLRDATRLVIEAGLATGHADTCVDLVSEVLRQVRGLREQVEPRENVAYLNLKLMQAQTLLAEACRGGVSPGWVEKVKAWLNAPD